MKRHALFRIAVLAIALSAATAFASVPRLINYQGVLTDATGVPLEGAHALTFKVYEDSLAAAPAWTEAHPGVALSKGVFNVILGGVTPLTDTLFSQPNRWMGITVDAEPETSPRMRLTSVPWAVRAAIADSVVIGAMGDSAWEKSEGHVYRASGNVGIGTATPQQRMHIKGDGVTSPGLRIEPSTSTSSYLELRVASASTAKCVQQSETGTSVIDVDPVPLDGSSDAVVRFFRGTNTTGARHVSFLRGENTTTADAVIGVGGGDTYFQGYHDGNVGIGTTAPQGLLDVSSGWSPTSALWVRANASTPDQGGIIHHQNQSYAWQEVAQSTSSVTSGALAFNYVSKTDPSNVIVQDVMRLKANGTVAVKVLEITGADLVESFDTGDRSCEAGTVVVIDAAKPGNLRISSEPYDARVAGVVSGAGDLPAGIRMGEGSGLRGDTPVAMTGRVYVKCTTENGPIVPGDRLTTSSLEGHAMKATDPGRSDGAVIGKAMSELREGEGLVLVLVNLQ